MKLWEWITIAAFILIFSGILWLIAGNGISTCGDGLWGFDVEDR